MISKLITLNKEILEININVVHDIAFGDVLYNISLAGCGVRCCIGATCCTILSWGGVVYENAQGELVYYSTLNPKCNSVFFVDVSS